MPLHQAFVKMVNMRTVLITGGSEGIGFELARCFAKDGYHIILAARNEDKLKKAAEDIQHEFQVPVRFISVDLSLKGSAQTLFEETQSDNIDVLINNAGCGYTGVCWENGTEADEKMVELNVTSLLVLSNLSAKRMAERGSGVILNIASTGAFQPGPYIAAYYASKAFVVSYTRALQQELKGKGVQVYCLCPGPVKTEFYAKSGTSAPLCAMKAESCARYAYHHMHGHKCIIIPGISNKAALLVPVSLRMHAVKAMKHRKMRK